LFAGTSVTVKENKNKCKKSLLAAILCEQNEFKNILKIGAKSNREGKIDTRNNKKNFIIKRKAGIKIRVAMF